MENNIDKDFINTMNKGLEELKTNTGIIPNTIIAPKSIIGRLIDVQNKQLQIDIWRQQGKTATGEPWKGIEDIGVKTR